MRARAPHLPPPRWLSRTRSDLALLPQSAPRLLVYSSHPTFLAAALAALSNPSNPRPPPGTPPFPLGPPTPRPPQASKPCRQAARSGPRPLPHPVQQSGTVGNRGESCTAACKRANKRCVAERFPELNNCRALQVRAYVCARACACARQLIAVASPARPQSAFKCTCQLSEGPDQPCLVHKLAKKMAGICLRVRPLRARAPSRRLSGSRGASQTDARAHTCDGAHPDTIRLCPCH